MKTQKHPTKKWEVSLIELTNGKEKKYKVTRKLPEMNVAETKIFLSEKEAEKQYQEWLK